MAVSKYRAVYGLRRGQLHQALGVSSKKIPKEKLDAAMDSLNEHVKAMAELAKAHKESEE